MSKYIIKKFYNLKTILLILLYACLLTGCKYKNTNESDNRSFLTPTPVSSDQISENQVNEAQIPDSQKPDNQVSEIDNSVNENVSILVKTDNKNQHETSETYETPKLEDFSIMDDFIIDYNFDISFDESLDSYSRTYTFCGEYDLNRDGIAEKIKALIKPYHVDGSYLEVNDIRVPLFLGHPSGEMYIIDIDSSDKFYELAIFDLGPSDDPAFDFYRYDGKELIYLFSIDRAALMDGKGKFISSFHLTTHFEPKFYSAWGEYKNGEYVIHNHDISQYLKKTYEFDGMAYFVPTDEMPESYFDYVTWDYEAQKDFEATRIKLLDVDIDELDPTLNWFFVEMPDGQKGMLYFWIGD